MHLGNHETARPDQGDYVPTDFGDPKFVEGRHYLFTLVWTGSDGILYTSEFDAESKAQAAAEASEILDAHPGFTDAVLGDQNGDEIPLEPLEPIQHLINFKNRRACVLRGKQACADAIDRGFEFVTPAHFVKYLDNAKKGFRSKKVKK